jgi:hypothetical protein
MYRQFIDAPHLIFQIHDTQADGPLDFPDQDILVLRGLAERYAAIASLPGQENAGAGGNASTTCKRKDP